MRNTKSWLEEERAKEEQGIMQERLRFREAMNLLPRVLMTEVLKRLGTAILVAFITIIMIVLSRDWMYLIGLCLSLLAAYLGLDIVWKFSAGKILVARMLVCKSNRSIRHRNKYHVILRDASIENLAGREIDTFKYDITVAARDIGNLTAGTVLDIYIFKNSPHAILAYEILGEQHNK